MAKIDLVKEQIQTLITKANQATGKSDTNLTDGVDSLIEGYGIGGIETYGGSFECSDDSGGEYEVVKKIAFTDRPSLYAFLEEKHGGVLRAFLKLGDKEMSGTATKYNKGSDNSSVFYICNVNLDEDFENNELARVRVSGASVRIGNNNAVYVGHEGIVASKDGTVTLNSTDNTQLVTIPDAYWSSLGAECILLYTETDM